MKIAVIGGGPAGLMAAEAASAAGARVELYDSMASAGRKFLLAGKGGLNITHSESSGKFLARYGARRAHIAPLLESFGPEALRAWVRRQSADAMGLTLLAEALMTQRARDYWRKDGSPRPWTPEILSLLERALDRLPIAPPDPAGRLDFSRLFRGSGFELLQRLRTEVVEPVLGRDAKEAALRELAARLGLAPAETLAVGDGANDAGMVRAAGLGVAFHAKPALRAVADAVIDHGDLTALLYLQGYRRDDFAA